MNPNFEITYELDTSSEENLKKSLSKAIADNLNGNLRDEKFAKMLWVASQTISTVQHYRNNVTRIFWKIRHHMTEIRKYIDLNYSDGYNGVNLKLSPDARNNLERLQEYGLTFEKELVKYLEQNGSWTDEKPVYGILHEICAVASFIHEEYVKSNGMPIELSYMYSLAEQVMYYLVVAKAQINDIKINIIADRYYCDISADPMSMDFNPINYRFNNPDYSQPPVEQYNSGFRPDWRPNFNPNVHKDYYQVYKPVPEQHNHFGGVSNRTTQPTCDKPTKGYTEQPTIHSVSGRKPYSEQPVAPRNFSAGSTTPPVGEHNTEVK